MATSSWRLSSTSFTPDQGQWANLYLMLNAVEAISLGTALSKMHLPEEWPPKPDMGGPSDWSESECITRKGPIRASLLVTGTLLLGSGRVAEALVTVTLHTKSPEPTQFFPPSLLPKTCWKWKYPHLSNMSPSCSRWLGLTSNICNQEKCSSFTCWLSPGLLHLTDLLKHDPFILNVWSREGSLDGWVSGWLPHFSTFPSAHHTHMFSSSTLS